MKPSAPAGYLLSLPERAIRSLSALSGGLLREIGEVALPAALRRTTLYRAMVGVTLQFLIEEVGQVEGVYGDEAGGAQTENFVVQRTASHGIELLGILAFHASPVWVLAALADLTGGGQKLLEEITQALQQEGLLEPETRFESMEQILGGLERTSGHLAMTLNLPPVDVTGLRREWERLKDAATSIPPNRLPELPSLERMWADLGETARRQDRSILAVSSLMAVSALAKVPSSILWLSKAATSAARRTTAVLGGPILDHYATALGDIADAGFVGYWKREFRPYLRAAAEQFAPEHESLTERLLRRPLGRAGL